MNDLTVIEHQSQRVLTTAQLADAFGTDTQNISRNYTRNAARYTSGKHYFALGGEEKRDFLNHVQIDDGLKNAVTVYLWTEKGAWMHAKSLNTDEAWSAYESLVDDYYAARKPVALEDLIIMQAQSVKDLKAKVSEIEARTIKSEETVAVIQGTIIQRDEDWRKQVNDMLKGASYRSGGNYSELRTESYRILEERAHCDLDKRMRNLLKRLEENGATKTKIREANKMDVIENDDKIKEIYTAVVKELSIGSLAAARG
jgi:hypothetical protein